MGARSLHGAVSAVCRAGVGRTSCRGCPLMGNASRRRSKSAAAVEPCCAGIVKPYGARGTTGVSTRPPVHPFTRSPVHPSTRPPSGGPGGMKQVARVKRAAPRDDWPDFAGNRRRRTRRASALPRRHRRVSLFLQSACFPGRSCGCSLWCRDAGRSARGSLFTPSWRTATRPCGRK